MNKMNKKKIKSFLGAMQIHKVWHEFLSHVEKNFYTFENIIHFKKGKIISSKRKIKVIDFFKLQGYPALSYVDKYVRTHKNIIEVRCDDNCHAGSSLFIVPHKDKKQYWGTSVVFIPQCAKDQNVFFLYPCHLDNLIKELKKIQKESKKLNKNNKDY